MKKVASLAALGAARQTAGLYSSPVSPQDSFGSVSGLDISDADIEKFIDADVQGQDRKLAHAIMKWMPKQARGEFLYVDASGRLISNRDVIRQQAAAANGIGKVASIYPPPANSGQGGPFYRQYSTQQITAAMGFVTIPCSDELFLPGDTGDTYFGENGPQSGQTEGGLQVTANAPSMTLQTPSIQLYGRTTYRTANGGYSSVTFPAHYNCNTPISLVYGHLDATNAPGFVTAGHDMFFTVAGYPQWNPLTYQIPGGVIISTNASWVFDNVPSDFIGAPGSDGTNTHTPCYACYVRRMDSIAQTVYNSQSGECFGMCNGTIAIRWDQVYMGQITSFSITNNGYTISDTIKVSGENWYGGTQYFPDQTRVQSSTANLPANSINFDFEGLNMSANRAYSAAGSFGNLIPIPSPSPRPVPSPNPCRINPRNCV